MAANSKLPTPVGQEEIVFKGEIIAVTCQKMQIKDKIKIFERARRSPGSRSIIISSDQKILITKEYRTEIKDWDYRLPGGKVCDTLEEYLILADKPKKLLKAAQEGAKKEVRQEAGAEIKSMELFMIAPSGGPTIEWNLYYFVVRDFVVLPKQDLGEGEHIQIGWYTIPEVIKLCLLGKMRESRSAGVLLQFLHSIGKI